MTDPTPAVEPVVPPANPVPATDQGVIAEPPAASADPASDPPADGGTPPADDGAGGKPRSRAQERIEELARANRNLREHNDWLRQEALKARNAQPATPAAPAAPAPAEPVAEEPRPTLESVGYDQAKFADALTEWTQKRIDRGIEQGVAKALSTREAQAVEQSQTKVVLDAAVEFRKTHEDFDLVIGNPNLKWTPTVLETLRDAGQESPALGYFLGNNPDKLAEIAALRPTQQVRALERISAQLTKTAAPAARPTTSPTPPAEPPKTSTPAPAPAAAAKKPATTNAPPPPTPVSGAAPADIDPLTLSPVEWRKWRNQQLADKRAGQAKPGGRVVRSF